MQPHYVFEKPDSYCYFALERRLMLIFYSISMIIRYLKR